MANEEGSQTCLRRFEHRELWIHGCLYRQMQVRLIHLVTLPQAHSVVSTKNESKAGVLAYSHLICDAGQGLF